MHSAETVTLASDKKSPDLDAGEISAGRRTGWMSARCTIEDRMAGAVVRPVVIAMASDYPNGYHHPAPSAQPVAIAVSRLPAS